MLIAGSPQTPALGAALSAAVTAGAAAGGYDDVRGGAGSHDRRSSAATLHAAPRGARRSTIELYAIYRELHDLFGGVAAPPGGVARLGRRRRRHLMKRLLALREEEIR